MPALSRDQLRRVDRLAIEQFGIPGIVLMENAGRAVAEETLKLLRSESTPCLPGSASPSGPFRPFSSWPGEVPPHPGSGETSAVTAVLLCGGGNNGGDGYVAARHLHNAGVRVLVCNAAPSPFPLPPGGRGKGEGGGDAAVFRAIVEKMNLPCLDILDAAQLAAAEPELAKATVFIDALLGTGFHGEVQPHLAAIIRRCNALACAGAKVVAVDVPSGMDCDTGRASDPTIRADLTVTFVALKKGFLAPEAKPYLGEVVVASIGAPPELLMSDE